MTKGDAEDPLERTRRQCVLLESGGPFPVEADPCPSCDALMAERAAAARCQDEAAVREAEQSLLDHRELHVYVAGLPSLEEDAQLRRRYLEPAWDDGDGRPVLREPLEGFSHRSLGFFIVHRHRFGQFIMATMADYLDRGRAEDGEATYRPRLRLYDDQGRVLELRGLTAGYRGSGPSGTVVVLRLAGFPDQRPARSARARRPGRGSARAPGEELPDSRLERQVFTSRHFSLALER